MEYFDKGLLLNFSFLDKMKTAAFEFERDERPSPTQGIHFSFSLLLLIQYSCWKETKEFRQRAIGTLRTQV